MKYSKSILIVLAALMVLSVTGCSTSARTADAERRWERTMEKARMEAAQESIEQGRLTYAMYLLEDLVESDSIFADQAQQMLVELRKITAEFAQVRDVTAYVDRTTLIN